MLEAVKISKSLAKRLQRVAEKSRMSPDALVNSALKNQLDYEEWMLREVDKGIASADRGRLLTTDEVFASLEKQRAARAGTRKKVA